MRMVKPSDEEVTTKTLSALTTGDELGLERLDQMLEAFNVREAIGEQEIRSHPRCRSARATGPSNVADPLQGRPSECFRAPPTRHRVMIVDDERLMRWSLAETLSEHACDLVEAGDARSACTAT